MSFNGSNKLECYYGSSKSQGCHFLPRTPPISHLDIAKDRACILTAPRLRGDLTFPVTEEVSQGAHMSPVVPLPEVSPLSLPQAFPSPKPIYPSKKSLDTDFI